MKLIFLQEVKGTAKKGEVKEITDGYALNFLIPKGLAAKVSPESLARIKKESERQVKLKAVAVSRSQILADKLKGVRVEVKAKANKEGKFYASISEKDVKQVLQKRGFDLSGAGITFSSHIKEAGDYEVSVDFDNGINAKVVILARA